jgi:uncharacterized membrane protein
MNFPFIPIPPGVLESIPAMYDVHFFVSTVGAGLCLFFGFLLVVIWSPDKSYKNSSPRFQHQTKSNIDTGVVLLIIGVLLIALGVYLGVVVVAVLLGYVLREFLRGLRFFVQNLRK